MSTAVRPTILSKVTPGSDSREELLREGGKESETSGAGGHRDSPARTRTRVHVAAENRLLREALSRMLTRRGEVDVVVSTAGESSPGEESTLADADILLLTASGSLADDVSFIRRARTNAPEIKIVVVGTHEEEMEFLHYVRAGVKGYLPRDASADDVMAAMRTVVAGDAVCPGHLCAALFRFFAQEANSLASATVHYKLGLTRREQQIVPLVAQGLTNKEIANRFCLSEQTIKNHLYRMKQKIGAPDRLGIVQLCRAQGFLA